MKVCGPKLSLCGMIIGIWGVIMLVLLGIFFYVNSVALGDDLPINVEKWESLDETEGKKYIDGLYAQSSTNCFIAGALYVAVTVFSFIQYKLNARVNYSIS